MTAVALGLNREHSTSSLNNSTLHVKKLKEQVRDNIDWLMFLSELNINKWEVFCISSWYVKVFDLIWSIDWWYKIDWNRKIYPQENAKKEIEEWLIYDMENWKLEHINHIKISPRYLLFLLIEWALNIDEIRKIRVIDWIIVAKNICFNLWSKTKNISLICSKDIDYWFATFDKNGNIL